MAISIVRRLPGISRRAAARALTLFALATVAVVGAGCGGGGRAGDSAVAGGGAAEEEGGMD